MARTRSTWGKTPNIIACLGIANICRMLDPALIQEALTHCGKSTKRYRDLPSEAVVYFVISMSLYMHVNLREVLFSLLEGLRMVRNLDIKVVGKSAISQARTRIGAEPLRYLYQQHVQPIAEEGSKGDWYQGKRLVSIDGSTMDIPDETENRQTYHGPTSSHGTIPFPQIRFVCLAEVGTRVLFAAKMADYKTSEHTLALQVVTNLKPDMLCLADRGFNGYDLWRKASETGADLLWRVRKDIPLPVKKILPDGSYLSSLLSREAKRRNQKPIPVRVIEYHIDGVEGSDAVTYRLMTTLLDYERDPAETLAHLYYQRWEIETAFDELKTHLRGQRVVLRSKTPELVEQEFYGLLLAHFTVRKLMYEAARKADIDPDDLSFTHSLRVIRRKLPTASAFSPSKK